MESIAGCSRDGDDTPRKRVKIVKNAPFSANEKRMIVNTFSYVSKHNSELKHNEKVSLSAEILGIKAWSYYFVLILQILFMHQG